MSKLNWWLLGILIVVIIIVAVIIFLVRRRAKNLDGLCGIQENNKENPDIPVGPGNERSDK